MNIEFSVIVCTYNRAHNLPRCLGALSQVQDCEQLAWEVLVVDNNSSDDTRKVIARLARELPIEIRYVHEPQQGLNYARNRGIRESRGRFIAYVDDDIAVCPVWASAIYKNFITNDADAVGGRIHLDPSIKLPAWIQDDEIKGFLGFQDYGEVGFRMDGKRRYPYGGNMAICRRVVDKIGYFNPLLGRKGEGRKRSELFKGAETDYFHRLADTGSPRIFYEPDAVVYHQVQPFQLKKKYFRTIHYNAGYQYAYFDEKTHGHTIAGAPRYLYRMLVASGVEYLRQFLLYGADSAFRQQMNVWHMLGTIRGYNESRARLKHNNDPYAK